MSRVYRTSTALRVTLTFALAAASSAVADRTASAAEIQGSAAQPQGSAAQTQGSASDDSDVVTAPVTLDGVELFRVRGVSSYSAEARAGVIADRIAAAAADASIPLEALHAVPVENAVRLEAGNHVLMAVVDADAAVEGVSRSELAAAHVIQVRDAIAQYRQARTPEALRSSTWRTAIATGLLIAVLAALFWFWSWFDSLLHRRVEARIHSVGIQSFEVMRAEQIRKALQNSLLALRVIVLLGLALVYAGYVLRQWPSTHAMSHGIAGLALDPLRTLGAGFVANIPRLAFLIVLFVLVRVVLRITRLFFDAVGRGTVTLRRFDPEWSEATYKIVRILIVAFGLVVAYPYIPGSQTEAFKGVSLFIGIVFSLGSSSVVSNVIAGYMMTYRRAFKVGDRVKIGDSVGDVIETRLQVTHVRSLKNEEIVIPNSEILSGQVLNYSSLGRERSLLLHTEVGIGYATAWRHVETILLEAAARTPGLATDPRPFVLVKRLSEFAVTYELNVPCGDVHAMTATYSALHRNVLDVFNEHGVQIMTPAYEGDPPEPKVVSPHDLYAAPPASATPASAAQASPPRAPAPARS
jgi:small-conductance mechanosensitive channel